MTLIYALIRSRPRRDALDHHLGRFSSNIAAGALQKKITSRRLP